MTEAKLRVTVPEASWIGTVSREYPTASITVLAAIPGAEAGVGLASVEADPAALPDLLSETEDHPAIDSLSLLREAGDEALLQFETKRPTLLTAVRESGVPLEFPFEVRNAEAEWEVTAPRESLSTLGEWFDERGISFEVVYVRESRPDDSLLTDDQRDLLATALEAGYYATPREITLTELAAELDLAKSTLSERLHRIESAVLGEYVEETARPRRVPNH